MKMENGRFVVYENALKESHSKAATRWQNMLVKKFNYDPDEKYILSLHDNPYLGSVFGLKDILRGVSVKLYLRRQYIQDQNHH